MLQNENTNTLTNVNLYASFNRNCKAAEILTSDEALIDNVPAFIRTIRENPNRLFSTINVPTVEDAATLEHGELPAIIGTGKFDKTRSNATLLEWNRLVWLDIDCVDKTFKKSKSLQFFKYEIQKLKALLSETTKVYAFCLSKSGKGLRVIYRIPDVHDITIAETPAYYTDIYMTLKKVIDKFLIENNLGFFEVDKQAADISHAFAIVADPDAMCFNYTVDAKSFKNLLQEYKTKEKKFKSKYKTVINKEVVSSLKVETLKLNASIRLNSYTTRFQAANAISYLFGTDGLDYYLSIVEGKDIAEYKGFYNYGLSKRNRYSDDEINKLLLTADRFFDLKLPKEFIKDDDGEADEDTIIPKDLFFNTYLTELKDEVIQIIENDKHIVIDAPTNTGKTTLSKQLSEYYKIDFIAPTQAIVKQQEKDIKIVIGNDTLTDEMLDARILAAPYESIGKLESRKAEMLIVDESHHLIEDYIKGFRKKSIRRILDSFHRYKYVMLLSGTPSGLQELDGFKLYRFRKHNAKKVKLHDYLTFAEVVEKDAFLAIYINDKDKGVEYKKKLVDEFKYKEDEIALINSDEKEGETYKGLLTEQLLDKRIRCIIATKLIADGVNINNVYKNVNIFFPEVNRVSYNEIKQFSTRFRKMDVELYTSSFSDNSSIRTSVTPSLNELEIEAAKLTEEINKPHFKSSYFLNRFENLNDTDGYFRDIKEAGITHDTITKIIVDEMYLIRKLVERENLLFRNSVFVRKDKLAELDIDYVDQPQLCEDVDIKEINGEVLKNKKEHFKQNIQIIDTLIHEPNLTKAQKQLVRNYYQLLEYGVTDKHALSLIQNAKSKQEITQHLKSLKFNINLQLIETNKVQIESSDSVSIMVLLKSTYDTFKGKIGSEFTPDQLNNFFTNLIEYKKDKWSDLKYFNLSQAKVIEMMNIVFDCKLKVSKDSERKSIRSYKIVALKNNDYFKIKKDVFEAFTSLFDM